MTLSDIPEHQRARQWRESAGLSRPRLSQMTGYSVQAIADFERGTNAAGKPIGAPAFKRFRLTIAGAISAPTFDFDRLPKQPVEKLGFQRKIIP